MSIQPNDEIAFLNQRILELELENALLKRGLRNFSGKGKTVTVPKEIQPLFDTAEENVRKYFTGIEINPNEATIKVNDERYVLVRASALSFEFFNKIIDLYSDRGEKEAVAIGKNILFDLAHVIGIEDARNFHIKMNLKDPIAKLSAGPVHFAYTGWAYVEILPDSHPTPDDNFFLKYYHPFSFEAASWLKSDKITDFPVCTMNAGYSSGWCEESFGIPLTTVEITCRAKGDTHCTFIMAPPNRIQDYLPVANEKTNDKIVYDIPLFFERKKAEEKIKASLYEKEILLKEIHHRVKNNLQIISSLLKLQSSTANDPVLNNLLLSSQQRIKTMAIVHEKLYESDLQHVNVSGYLHSIAQLAHSTFADPSKKISFDFNFSNELLSFKIDKAIPCGLIANELITNAFKYAFKGRNEGTIHLKVNKHNNNLCIIVGDNGIGLPEAVNPDTAESLGFQLIEILAQQIEAKLTITRINGTQFEIHIPIDEN